MSIRIKLPLLVLAAFFINILLIGAYYNFFFSAKISQDYNKDQEELQMEAEQISSELKGKSDLSFELDRISNRMDVIIYIEDEAGNIIFHSGKEDGNNLEHTATRLFRYEDKMYLLKVERPVVLTRLSSFETARVLFRTETVIICFILIFVGIVIYFQYVKPIVTLQKSMECYRSGIYPQRITRKDEIGLLQDKFVDLADTIEEEKQKQNRMIAYISHDIKTPLTSVMGYAERLKKSTLSSERYELYVDTIYNKAVAIKNLIDEFDEYLNYHIQSELKLQTIPAEKLCRILELDYRAELEELGIDFRVDNKCTEEMISVDITKLRRVFGNVISNSIKHFTKDKPYIHIFCCRDEDAVTFSVEDNGTGIQSADDMKKIFDPFYTSDKGRSVAGLGLSICKEIIEAHKGCIAAENKKDGGFRIIFRLPVYKNI